MDLFGVGSGGCRAAIGVTGRCTLRTLGRLLVVLTLCCATARSQTSNLLYIPGFDPQPVSTNVAGIGADGATTWILHQGRRDPTDTSSYPDFIGTATLVEGPQYASLTYANLRAQLTMGQICTFSESTLAVCTVVAQGSTATQTEIISHFPVQVGASLTSSSVASPTSIGTTKLTSVPATTTMDSDTHSPPSSTSNHSMTSPPPAASNNSSISLLLRVNGDSHYSWIVRMVIGFCIGLLSHLVAM